MRKSAFMEACQPTRKETKMETVHLKQDQVAARWNLSEATLERWRSEGIDPKFLKLRGQVRYRLVDIEAFEFSCLATSTQSRVTQHATCRSTGQAHRPNRYAINAIAAKQNTTLTSPPLRSEPGLPVEPVKSVSR